ncbi:MAG: hypothetical protein H7319_09335 [Spirosoma sp.]|nr:hypothetical protein [Spirosoma sp.]
MSLFLLGTSLAAEAQTVTGRQSHHRAYPAKRPAPRPVYVAICESRSAYAYHAGIAEGWQGVRTG